VLSEKGSDEGLCARVARIFQSASICGAELLSDGEKLSGCGARNVARELDVGNGRER
tara:strand:- start:440 stop:610 length:171 start_codon:yes stop_codon:yes gene_type:complete